MRLLQRLSKPAAQGYGRPIPFWQRIHVDPWLLLLLIALASVAAFVLYSASGRSLAMLYRQGAAWAVGLAVMLIVAQFQPRFMQRWVPLAYVFGVGLLLAVLLIGVQAKGAQRWLNIPGLMRFQPSEMMKLVLPMMLAWYFGRHALRPSLGQVITSLGIIGIPVVLVLQQPDLGTSLLIATSGFFVLLLAGLRWRYMISAAILLLPGAFAMWHFVLHNYQKQRVLTFLNPESDPLGAGWNIIQSTTAIGSGGFWGKGWLQGTQSQLEFLPERHTDFIVAVLGEEFGLVGMLAFLLLYLLIVGRGLWLAGAAQETFGRLVAGSIILTFFIYVFVNVGMVSGILPVVGVPLPLVSYGGTSSVTLMAGFGILMAIHAHRRLLPR